MSLRHLQWALDGTRLPKLTPFEQLLLVKIADRVNGDDSGSFEGVPRTARELQTSERTVRRGLASLETKGLIRRERRFRETGAQQSNVVSLPRTPPDTSVTPPLTQLSPPPCHQCHPPPDTGVTHNQKMNHQDEPSPPLTPPSGGRARDRNRVREEWVQITEVGAGNHEVLTPRPRKWTPILDRALARIDQHLDGDWGELREAVRSASNGGAESPLDLSISRLSSRDCSRLEDLLSGRWKRKGYQPPTPCRDCGEPALGDGIVYCQKHLDERSRS